MRQFGRVLRNYISFEVGVVQFDDTIVGGDIDDTTAELMGELGYCLEMLVFMS